MFFYICKKETGLIKPDSELLSACMIKLFRGHELYQIPLNRIIDPDFDVGDRA